jgi:hypothetical protein
MGTTILKGRVIAVAAIVACAAVSTAEGQTVPANAESGTGPIEYRVLATNRTSTMEKELNAAAEAGFRFQAVMGGDTAFGGSEVVAVVSRAGTATGRFAYRLLATSRTSTMQKEMQDAADAGFEYRGQTVFSSALGGDEVVCILERDKDSTTEPSEYRLVATSRTATLQKELVEAGIGEFQVVGLTVGKTALGGNELVAIARRAKAAERRP